MDKIELSDKKIAKGATTVWSEHGEADIVMDLKKLSFRTESVGEIYSFHVLDHLFPEEIEEALKNWHRCLKTNGKIYIVVDDFEYVARGFVGGDLSLDLVNTIHNHPTQFSRDTLSDAMIKAGFRDIVIWYDNIPDIYPRKHYELILAGLK